MEPEQLEELRRQHRELDERISDEERQPGSDDLAIRKLKVEKLRIKEQIEEAERSAAAS